MHLGTNKAEIPCIRQSVSFFRYTQKPDILVKTIDNDEDLLAYNYLILTNRSFKELSCHLIVSNAYLKKFFMIIKTRDGHCAQCLKVFMAPIISKMAMIFIIFVFNNVYLTVYCL